MNRITKEEYKNMPLGCYHLCFDRLEDRNLFTTDEDYRLGMAGIALSTLKFGVDVYAKPHPRRPSRDGCTVYAGIFVPKEKDF